MNLNNVLFTEVYPSIQGEGLYTGILSLILRCNKCNLRCSFCDTKFSWKETPAISIGEAVEFVRKNNLFEHIIISGGEPLIHQKELLFFLSCFTHEELINKTITIETNCTISPSKPLQKIMLYYKGLWSSSPKTIDENYLHPLNKILYFNTFSNVQFKFAITSPIDVEIQKVKSLIDNKIITKPHVVIQPDGNRQDYDVACRELAEYVISNNLTNFRVLPQFHRICWGQRRGV